MIGFLRWGLVVTLGILVLSGCGASPWFHTVEYHLEVPLRPEETGPRGYWEGRFLDVDGPPERREGIHNLLYDGEAPLTWARQKAEVWATDYRKEAGDLEADLLRNPRSPVNDGRGMAFLNYYAHEESKWEGGIGPLVVVSWFREEYRGGAHGTHLERLLVLDLDTNRILGQADLVRPGFWDQLGPWVESDLRRQYDIPGGAPLTEGQFFEDHPTAPRELAPGPDGLIVLWNEYEVAPYVWGRIRVTVPWSLAAEVLTDRARTLVAPWIP